jgi:hypothetical protein
MILASANLAAQETSIAKVQEATCHNLMTERECVEYRSAWVTLPAGKVRDQFLADHVSLIQERESLCNCKRANADTVVLYPRIKQVARHL